VPNIIKTVDVSSAQTPSLDDLNDWIGQGCQLLWIHSYHSGEQAGLANSSTRPWIAAAKTAGVWHLPYCWLFRTDDPRQSVREAIQVFRDAGENPQLIALDCENYLNPPKDPGPTAEQILAACEEARGLAVEPIVYSGKPWLDSMSGNHEILRGVPAWIANFNFVESLTVPAPDWVEVFGHQYRADGLDWSVFDLDALTRLAQTSH
jgi:glycosyl hydrolase family 25